MTPRNRSFAALVAALLGLLALGSAGVAGAQTTGGYPPAAATLVVSVTVAVPGEPIQVSGSGFLPNSQVALVLGTTLLRNVAADTTGAFSTTVTVPCPTPPGPTTLQAQGTGPGNAARVLSSNLTITPGAVGVCVAGAAIPTEGALPRTGSSSSAPLTAAGVGLVVIGIATVITARRRRVADAAGL